MNVNATQSSDSDQIPCSTGEVPDHLKNLYSEELMTVNATQSSDSDQILQQGFQIILKTYILRSS